jgi:hypothetical protein
MTALEKFLKQIVLKQVEGSVYLVPAICDFQIEEALEEERKQGQNLPISDVSNRRELLIAFLDDINARSYEHIKTDEGKVDAFLSNL